MAKRIDLDKFTEFGQVKSIYSGMGDCDSLYEFVTNVIMNENQNIFFPGVMLPYLSHLYVLIAKPHFPWNQLLFSQKHLIDLSVIEYYPIIGYIWIKSTSNTLHDLVEDTEYNLIDMIDSRISGLNIVKHMITKFEEKKKRLLFPYYIIESAKYYWKKYFIEVYNVNTEDELKQLINNYHIQENDIKWENLILAYQG